MKKILLLAATIVSLVATSSIAQTTNTNLVRAFISVTCISTNGTNDLVYDRIRTTEFIEEFATSLGITTNATNFSLVYNLTNRTLQVVSGTNQTLVGTALSFTNVLSITNADSEGTVVEFQYNVRVWTNSAVTGTLTGTQRYGASNDFSSFLLTGRLAYVEPASGTNAPAICRGILVVTNRDLDDDDGPGRPHDGNPPGNGRGNQGNGNGNGGPAGDPPPHGNAFGHNNNNGNGNGNNGNGNNGNGNGNGNGNKPGKK
jgi:hypothetical protein